MTALRTLLVESSKQEALDVVSLRLIDPSRLPLPKWSPGAHIDVVLPSGLVRQYSLCGDPADTNAYQIAVLREPGGRGGSIEIHETALVGMTIEASDPRNLFDLVDSDCYLFIVGGIGITPILPMMRSATLKGAPWRLVYGGRTRASMAFIDEIVALGGESVEIIPEDEKGKLDVDSIVGSATPTTAIYCCGPEGLIAAVEQSAGGFNLSDSLHVERFTSPEPPSSSSDPKDKSFEVELHRSGVVLVVPPERSMLDVIREAIPTVESSCESGFCGACVVDVLEGTPEHRDTVLSDEEHLSNKLMMICVGRAKSDRIVLDL